MKAYHHSIQESVRLREVLIILSKYGLADLFKEVKIDWVRKYTKSRRKELPNQFTKHQLIRMALSELGTTFIKLGQLLSTRSDLVGIELAEELSKLQSSTPADPFEYVEATILNEFQVSSLQDVFAEFNVEPMASASIAQVHRASLRTGEQIVVKVMHEGIIEKVKSDLEIIAQLANMAEQFVSPLKIYQPVATVRELKNTMLNELDFRKELSNMQVLADNFANNPGIHIPVPVVELSGRKILSMEFVKGTPLGSLAQPAWPKERLSHLAEVGAHAYLEMIFRDNFYHADPHPGNLLMLEDGSLCILDFGMMGRVDQQLNESLEELMIAISQNDIELIRTVVIELGRVPPGVNYEVLTTQIDDFVESYLQLPLEEVSMGQALKDMISIIHEHHIILPAKTFNLLRVVMMLEGTGKALNPKFSISSILQKYQYKIIRHKFSQGRIGKKLTRSMRDWDHIFSESPRLISNILNRAQKEDFEVRLEHRNLEKSVNRLVMGILTAALFLGSSLLLATQVPPLFRGLSLAGLAGMILAFLLGLKLVKDIYS